MITGGLATQRAEVIFELRSPTRPKVKLGLDPSAIVSPSGVEFLNDFQEDGVDTFIFSPGFIDFVCPITKSFAGTTFCCEFPQPLEEHSSNHNVATAAAISTESSAALIYHQERGWDQTTSYDHAQEGLGTAKTTIVSADSESEEYKIPEGVDPLKTVVKANSLGISLFADVRPVSIQTSEAMEGASLSGNKAARHRPGLIHSRHHRPLTRRSYIRFIQLGCRAKRVSLLSVAGRRFSRDGPSFSSLPKWMKVTMKRVTLEEANGWFNQRLGYGTEDSAASGFLLSPLLTPNTPGSNENNTASGEGGSLGMAQRSGRGTGDVQTSIRGEGGGEGDGCGGEGGDAGGDRDGGDDGGAGGNSDAGRCDCVVCGIQLGAEGFVLIPGQGYAHRECAEEFFPGYDIAPRARQQPIRLVPAFEGTSHFQRDAGVTRLIAPLTHPHPRSQPPTGPRPIAPRPSGRRRGGVGQGRGPVEVVHQTGTAIRVPFSEMQGLWVALPGSQHCLVVATGTAMRGGQLMLLVVPRGGGRRRAIPWQNGQPEAEVMCGEPRELAEGRPRLCGPHESPRGVWQNGAFVDAVIKAGRIQYSIHRVALPDSTTASLQRARQEAARALSVMEALSAIASRPFPAAQVRDPEESRAAISQQGDRSGTLGARQPSSQRGIARALFVSAPTNSELSQLRGLASTARGLSVNLVTLTACPFNAAGAFCWGSSWVAQHGHTQLARGSCSALSFNCSAALLAAAQEALL